MSDFNSSLPVRTENNGDVVAQLVDGTITTQKLAIDSNGSLKLVSSGPVTPGTVATFSNLIGGQYNTTLPTLTSGQQAAVQVDSRGRLLISSSNFPTTVDTNYGTVGNNTLRSAAQIGNATGAADFNSGASGAQTLRTASNTNDGVGTPITSTLINSKQRLDVNLASGGPVTPGTAAFQSILIGGQYNTVLPTLTTGQQAATQVDSSGRLIISPLSSTTSSVSVSNFPTTVDTNYGTVGVNTIRTASQIGNATGAANFGAGATTAQTLRVSANILDATGTAFSTTNPLPVAISDSPGTHINDYKDAPSIAASATDNHDYTVTAGKTLHLNQIESSASGKAKMDVKIETGVATGIFTTYWTQFNSTATPNMHIEMLDDILVAAGVRVRVIMTNKDNQAQDLYSTISGFEV